MTYLHIYLQLGEYVHFVHSAYTDRRINTHRRAYSLTDRYTDRCINTYRRTDRELHRAFNFETFNISVVCTSVRIYVTVCTTVCKAICTSVCVYATVLTP